MSSEADMDNHEWTCESSEVEVEVEVESEKKEDRVRQRSRLDPATPGRGGQTHRCGTLPFSLVLDPVSTYGSDDPDQLVPFILVRDVPGVIPGLQPSRMGHRPDLEEMHALLGMIVVLAMPDPRTRRSHLQIPTFEDLGIVQGIPVGELSVEDVGKDLKLSMSVSSESLGRDHSVLVDDPQGTVLVEPVVLVVGETERMKGLEPTVVGSSPFFGFTGSVFEVGGGGSGGGGHGTSVGTNRGRVDGGGDRAKGGSESTECGSTENGSQDEWQDEVE